MKSKRRLFRDTENKRIAGVCSGIADYFGIEVWFMRILTITCFFLLAAPFVFVTYVAAWVILDKKHKSEINNAENTVSIHDGKGWKNEASSPTGPVELKTKVWQAGEPPKQALSDIKDRFEQAELKLRNIETYVTSREFQLKREFNQL
ncbi:envelope stress response membrane protein PspC [Alteromonas sp. 5E99-2]|uniref:envelope stress response membrane protein PspC n=1 Tax=Alteromonas sp. 5E99-2 TaxID=2817683 RepID=UPI001A9830D5|nr:envelope stress response membrane protein PspC [Alteromonas sp. 5E99-2]MBO1255182.1 envelope stress response membrane protein PspC [Alteromonas sp. 5E99-2]